ncbi:integrase [Kaistia sp. 32K]|uniref:tyrosine-type recombinase/integrase n=1 Tax=Kaistia sp. 32K TaxID=2795690 RepID=UPI00191691EF|nr:tyrosine-type recombinase/integrase [Kaistia sp. 32K]BCP55830.1 integrase [Kaistia sp. 32K]
MNWLVEQHGLPLLPGETAAMNKAVLEFFAAQIRNGHTRKAYARATSELLAWCRIRGLAQLEDVSSLHIAAWLDEQLERGAPASAKQKLAAIKRFFEFLTAQRVLATNPAAYVKGPRFSVKRGTTPVIEGADVRKILGSIENTTIKGLRDRALIATMAYSFARIGAALKLDTGSVFSVGRRLWIRLFEKGGSVHEMPCHHTLEACLMEYLDAADLAEDPKVPLFQSIAKGAARLSGRRLAHANAYNMVRERARKAGVISPVCCHTFRATGITSYLMNGGTIEYAALMANHTSIRTTQLYDRRGDDVQLDEVEKIYF